MKEKIELVLSMLSEGFSINEIEELLSIDHKELNTILKTIKDLGYNYQKNYYSDGTIIIKGTRRLNFNPNENIKINVKGSVFHTLFISDPHVGGPYERIERLKTISDYALKHDIHTVFNTGDLTNNYYPDNEPNIEIKNPVEQANRYLEYLPYQEKIIYFNLGGNHDYRSLYNNYFDSLRYYEETRLDQISLGYGLCYVHLKEDSIALTHDIKGKEIDANSTMTFKGHSHKYRNRDNKIIYVPALSNNYKGAYEEVPLPGFLDTEFHFYNNKITKVNLKHLTFSENNINTQGEETIIVKSEYEERRVKKLLKKQKDNKNY